MYKYYSQFGEDWFLDEAGLLPNQGFFVDIGAGDPVKLSNTYLLEQRGWDGICVDPDKRQVKKLKEKRKRVIDAVVGKITGEIVSFKETEQTDLSKVVEIGQGETREVISLDDLLKKEGVEKIDLLSVDVEGLEVDILEGFSISKYLPRIIIVEFLTFGKPSQEDDIRAYFEKLPYLCIKRTQANLIFKLNT